MATGTVISRGSARRPALTPVLLCNNPVMGCDQLLSTICAEMLQSVGRQTVADFVIAPKLLSRDALKVGCTPGESQRQIIRVQAITSIDSARLDDLEYGSTCFDYRQSLHVVLAVPPHFAGM